MSGGANWEDVDAFIETTVVGADDALLKALQHQEESGLPSIASRSDRARSGSRTGSSERR